MYLLARSADLLETLLPVPALRIPLNMSPPPWGVCVCVCVWDPTNHGHSTLGSVMAGHWGLYYDR